jgi:curved DNA-binding protein CbpA
MTDHFAVLRQARRPWLDPERLKQKYQQLALNEHPDRKGRRTKEQSTSEPVTFTDVTEAYRVLSNPKLRVNHLLSITGEDIDFETSSVTAELADVFMGAATLVLEIDALLQKRQAATSALGKSLLKSEVAASRVQVKRSLEQLDQLYSDSIRDLQKADRAWKKNPSETAGELRKLAQRFGYLERWIGQLRERQFQLSS